MRSIAWRLIAVAVTATAVSFPMSTGVAHAATGVVVTSGAALTVRAGPGAGLDAWSSVANGSTVTILCQTEGSSVTGSQGTSTIWDMLSNGGFVSDAYVRTGSDGYVEKKCAYTGSPPRANPRGVNAAISWQFARLGSTDAEGWCMRFQAQSYGWGASGWASAEVGGDWIQSHGYMRTSGIPPRGAIVWYHNSAGTGHVVVSLGEGKIIGTSVNGRVGVAGYLYRTGYRGWSVPYFPAAG